MTEKKALAVFDFDGTMIRGDSVLMYMRLARRLHAMSNMEFLRLLLAAVPWLMKRKTDAALKTRAFRFYFALPADRRTALDRVFAEETLLPRVHPAAKRQLEKEKEAGKMTLLLSASTENYMRYVADALGFDGLICTEFEGDAVVHNCKGAEKPRRLKAWLSEKQIDADFAASSAYGDNGSDLPILRLCGEGYAVNPKRKLRQAAPDLPRLAWAEND